MKRHLIFLLILSILITGKAAYAGDMINKNLPKWLKVDLEVRHRLEWKDNFDFNDAANDEDTINLFRTRVNIGVTPIEQLLFFTQFQDVQANDAAQFSDGKKQPILWPEKYKTGTMIYPYSQPKP